MDIESIITSIFKVTSLLGVGAACWPFIQFSQVQTLAEHIFFWLTFFIPILFLLCQKMVDLHSTDVKFGVFKHTHIPTKVDYKFIVFNTKITNKMKKISKKKIYSARV